MGHIEIVVLIWILLLLTSPAWLANFQYGPLEWFGARSPAASASPSSAPPETLLKSRFVFVGRGFSRHIQLVSSLGVLTPEE